MAGAVYGDGVYFATQARTALRYCSPDENGHYYMYYSLVLTGTYTQGKAGMRDAPYRNDVNDVYDTVVDNTNDPSMFIIFRDNQAYPSYLITFV